MPRYYVQQICLSEKPGSFHYRLTFLTNRATQAYVLHSLLHREISLWYCLMAFTWFNWDSLKSVLFHDDDHKLFEITFMIKYLWSYQCSPQCALVIAFHDDTMLARHLWIKKSLSLPSNVPRETTNLYSTPLRTPFVPTSWEFSCNSSDASHSSNDAFDSAKNETSRNISKCVSEF